MKILLIEDEPTLSDMIVEYLHTEGYIVETATTFKEADEKSYVYEYDCLLVDIGLPDGNGLDIIKNLKQRRSVAGVIIISAKNSIDDRVQGLELGSDDYLSKPFHLAELNARLRALMRRRKFDGHTELIFNELKIVTDEMRVFVNTDEIVLTKKEYDLLLYFLTNKNRILTKESVVEHAWGDAIEQADSYDFIYTHIKNLEAVRTYVAQKLGNQPIKEAAKIVKADKTIEYEAEVGKKDYLFDSNGNFLKIAGK